MEETKKLGYDTTCPFNPAHLLAGESMQKHLLKCKKQHKSSNLIVCPFNQTHYIRKSEYAQHIKVCPDRILIESCRYTEKNDARGGTNAGQRQETTQPNYTAETTSYNGNDEENWDDMDVPAYNPLKYCLENKVIRQANHLTPAEKRAFYEEERIRHMELSKKLQQ
ncbi:gametocyte-specific factor 1 homolog [Anopheles darlingi]|uniref:gametocyte-specific factor 1 homolog n=1 Tax=Anopheles darlingi TaxID=43151 RepID=UPI0021000FBC|nr:gametocyte-specific factor 1 homolog [Anopheles darlingi]